MRRTSQTLSGENLKTLQQSLDEHNAAADWQVYLCHLVAAKLCARWQ